MVDSRTPGFDDMNAKRAVNSLRFPSICLPAGVDGSWIFEVMRSAFEEARKDHPGRILEYHCVFLGRIGRLRIIGHKLAEDTLAALGHLIREEAEPETWLKIDLWHESETQVSCPVGFIDAQKLDIPGWKEGQCGITVGCPNERFVGRRRFRTLMWMDRHTQHVIGWIKNSAEYSPLERANPVRFPLFLWHCDQRAEVIHAGLVSKNGKGILLGGKGGVGKTTTALACLYSGFDYLGDDYIGMQALDDGSYIGHSIYSSAWLPKEILSMFPMPVPRVEYEEYPGRQRYLVFLHGLFPDHLPSSARIRAVVLPRVTYRASSRLCPATKPEALLTLAPSSMIHLPNSGARTLRNFASLVEQIPCYWLDSGTDIESIPRCLEAVVS
jgi:hypothetical protein